MNTSLSPPQQALVSGAAPTSSLRLGQIRFTAHYGLSHSLGLVQPHSLESCVCENGTVSGDARTLCRARPYRRSLVNNRECA
jgi:hypothetical protein